MTGLKGFRKKLKAHFHNQAFCVD